MQKQLENMILKMFGMSITGGADSQLIEETPTVEQRRVGSHSNTAGKGVMLDSDNTGAIRYYADDGGVAATGNLRNVLSRVLLTINHPGGVSWRSITGQVKVLAGIDLTSINNVTAGVFGYLEIAGDSTFGGQVAAVEATIEGKGDITVSANGILAGVAARLNMASGKTITETGKACAFLAQATNESDDKWPKGFYAPGDSVDIGVQIGDHSNSGGYGVNLNAVSAANRFHADDGGSALTGGNLRNILARTLLTTDSAANASVRSVVGQVKILTGVDLSNEYSVLAGVMGYLEFDGISSQAGQVAAVEGTIEGADNITNTGGIFGMAARLNMASGKSIDGINAAFLAGTTVEGDDPWHAGIRFDGCDAAFAFADATSYAAGIDEVAQTPTGNTSHGIKVDIADGTTGYIAVYAQATFGND